MKKPNIVSAAASRLIGSRSGRRAVKEVRLLQCLIVSSSTGRTESLARLAAEGGWEAIASSSPEGALRCVSRMRLQLVMVDLEERDASELKPLLQSLAQTKGLLLVVCGNPGDEREEIWVRQLGAWLYLPGVVNSATVQLLFTEARHICERMAV